MRIEEQMEKEKEGKDGKEDKEAAKEEVKDVSKETDEANKEKAEEKIEPSLSVDTQINENISMMCPICHFFMYKSVCASCSHMFCQYCLDEYLIFKDSCPVWEKSIRKGRITRCIVADSAIEKMLAFSTDEYFKEWTEKRKFEDEYYAKKKLDDSILEEFQK